jgi:hypothetical protein
MKKKPSPEFVVVVMALLGFAIYFWVLPLVWPPFVIGTPTDNMTLAEKVKCRLGMDLKDLENSLTLTPVITGEEPFILTYSMALKVDAASSGMMGTYIPSDRTAQTRHLALLDNGKDAHLYEIDRQTNGTYLVRWNTTAASYGSHRLQVSLFFSLTKPQIVDGPIRSETVTNMLQWDYDLTGFGRWIDFHGFLQVTSADYSIQIFDTNNFLMKRIDGHTDKGVIKERWDSHPTNKYAWTEEDLKVRVYITPTIADTNGSVKSNAPTICVPYP